MSASVHDHNQRMYVVDIADRPTATNLAKTG